MNHISSIYEFLKELNEFSYGLSVLDCTWDILFPDKEGKWNRFHIIKYRESFYITHVNADRGLEIDPEKGVHSMDSIGNYSYPIKDIDPLATKWAPYIVSARKWLKTVTKDWIKANKRVQAEYPLHYRYGFVPNTLIRASLPDVYRLDKELGKQKTSKMIRIIEEGFFLGSKNTERPVMTANDYFQYCKIAYIAGKRKQDSIDKSLSGQEMYMLYADGRHEGLLDIDPDSEEEFATWIDGTHPKKKMGGHPWEIKRGGNTTHIDLSVSRPLPYRKEGFKVELRGESIGRMVETMRMFLGIYKEKLPISLANPENVRKRLLAQDNIGIVPSYASLHRANQYFSKDKDVFDVMHYNDLGRYKRRITPFITWEPLPILKPRERV